MRVVASVFVLLLATPAFAERLPVTAVPEQYALWFAPDFKTDTFRGRETIRVRLPKPAKSITLHAAEIDFKEVRIAAGEQSQTAKITLNEKDETATLTFAQEIPPGPAAI